MGLKKSMSNLVLRGRLLPLMRGADDTQLVIIRDMCRDELLRRDKKRRQRNEKATRENKTKNA